MTSQKAGVDCVLCRRSGRTLCSTHHTETIRPTVHPAVSRTDPTPRRGVLQYSADQLRREHDSWEVRIAGRLAHERLEKRETDDDRRSCTTRTRTGATVERIGMGPAPLPGPLARPGRTLRLPIARRFLRICTTRWEWCCHS